jgi:hypothetical protein
MGMVGDLFQLLIAAAELPHSRERLSRSRPLILSSLTSSAAPRKGI